MIAVQDDLKLVKISLLAQQLGLQNETQWSTKLQLVVWLIDNISLEEFVVQQVELVNVIQYIQKEWNWWTLSEITKVWIVAWLSFVYTEYCTDGLMQICSLQSKPTNQDWWVSDGPSSGQQYGVIGLVFGHSSWSPWSTCEKYLTDAWSCVFSEDFKLEGKIE